MVFKTSCLELKEDDRKCFAPAPCTSIGFLLCLDHTQKEVQLFWYSNLKHNWRVMKTVTDQL